MTDLTRRIEKLEARLEPDSGPLHVIVVETDRHGEPVRALDGGEVVAGREPGETAQAFRLRVFGPKGPKYTIRMEPDSGPLARPNLH
ncbi:MAG: hypothetical protein ACRES9_11720 [Gammaproteobacteria bacterium]